ncbi:hypothetical protein [Salmonirosea aquatica]|uniref:Methyltransferase domain-containing protein n=1 Tax=Salmonirosea aquatica TaxID=2654236 RepID=A0A7C9BMH0_9BACT|nr:hypothetical protein [Cytophagaceae bacterium SJW1-29]
MKYKYLARSIFNYFGSKSCPACGSQDVKMMARKFFVTRLFKCENCFLQFRHPKDNESFQFNFYQREYEQNDNITTKLPSDEELIVMKKQNFANKDVSRYSKIFKNLYNHLSTNEISLIDYGSSWGYQSFQFLKEGFDCSSFEISEPRARYGNEKLGLNIKINEAELPKSNHIFFSSHVIEHVPSPKKMITLGMQLLNMGGYFIAESPNGSIEFRERDPKDYNKLWGEVHPNFLTSEFYSHAFNDYPYLITSSPFNDLPQLVEKWDKKSQVKLDLTGAQMVIIARNCKVK